MNRKHIVCYGDSNTWGYCAATGGRYEDDVRWTRLLQEQLGEGYLVAEEGVCGRTTVFEDPLGEGLCGFAHLVPALNAHSPLDLLVVMLGTNDCKSIFRASPRVIARGVERLIETIQTFPYGEGLRVPKILLVSPIHMGPEIDRSEYASFDAESGERVKGLAAQYAASAEKYGCAFLNAAEVAKPGPDQLHMDAEGHRALAEALAPLVRSLI